MVYDRYGSPDVLALRDIDQPVTREGEVLVRVHAASINSWDWDLLTGTFQGRMGALRKPRYDILGADIAGRVEAVGSRVTGWQPGDDVYGDISRSGWGGFAEYVAVRASALAPKPAAMTSEQAAAVPQAAGLALQALRKKRVEPADRVLINGAGGGMGTFAVQIAKSSGAVVTGVDHAIKLDTVRSIGADHVIDYTREDFTARGETYDLIVDAVATRSIFDYRRALAPGGVCVIVGGRTRTLLALVSLGTLVSATGTRKARLLAYKPSTDDLVTVNGLFENGAVVPVIDSRYSLGELADAFRRFGDGQFIGKIVVQMDRSTP